MYGIPGVDRPARPRRSAAVRLVPFASDRLDAVLTVLWFLHGSVKVGSAELVLAYFSPEPSDGF